LAFAQTPTSAIALAMTASRRLFIQGRDQRAAQGVNAAGLDNPELLTSYSPYGAGNPQEGMVMLGISRLPASATFGGALALLAALAAPGSARADVTEVFTLFGDFENGSTLSGTLTVDTTAGSATAIDAAADGFEFKTITGQSSGLEYTVDADTAGNAAQLSLVFGVHSLVGYGGSSLSPDTTLNGMSLKGGGANPAESSPVPEPSTWALMLLGFAGLGLFAVRRGGKTTAPTIA
jgi:hypothetical protein